MPVLKTGKLTLVGKRKYKGQKQRLSAGPHPKGSAGHSTRKTNHRFYFSNTNAPIKSDQIPPRKSQSKQTHKD